MPDENEDYFAHGRHYQRQQARDLKAGENRIRVLENAASNRRF